jgi:hypothetical protein
MRRFLLGWKQSGWKRKLKARIVNYADDFVILCREKAEQAQAVMETMMRKLKLTPGLRSGARERIPYSDIERPRRQNERPSIVASDCAGLEAVSMSPGSIQIRGFVFLVLRQLRMTL